MVLSAPEVVALLAHLTGMPLIHRRDGHGYSYAGLNAMLRRYTAKANGIATGRAATGINKDIDKSKLAIQPFGYYDLKAKGATDMWLAGVALERIQVLCGHESVTTTERYVKCRWRGTVTPNRVAMAV